MAASDFEALDAYALANAIRSGQISPIEVVEHTLQRIETVDDDLNAFTVILADDARRMARQATRRAREDAPPPLLGVPVSVKDHIWTEGVASTNGSLALRDFLPDEDCAVVPRVRDAGAIVVGKTNNPEFAYRGYTDNDLFGLTRNPWNLSHTPGGSSGGSGAAVAAGLGLLSIGTDGGGSIRIPASFCGIVGLKPTFGLVPKLPGFRGWPTLSVHGPMARSVRDAALLLSVIAGPHPADDLSSPGPQVDFLAEALREDGLGDLRVAFTEDMGFAAVEEEVREAFRASVSAFRATGCVLEEAFPATGEPVELWWRIGAAEGYASEGPLLERHETDMTEGTPTIIRSGERYSARDYLDAQHERSRFTRTWAEFFEDFDLLLAPAAPIAAFAVGQGSPDEVAGHAYDPLFDEWGALTYVVNLTNQPSLAVPIGFSKNGLPLGMQIIARRFEDHVALRAGAAWQGLYPWHRRWPTLGDATAVDPPTRLGH